VARAPPRDRTGRLEAFVGVLEPDVDDGGIDRRVHV
jgi:hypothetical protein